MARGGSAAVAGACVHVGMQSHVFVCTCATDTGVGASDGA